MFFLKFFKSNTSNNLCNNALVPTVAEPPKLYGPHTPVIVLKTSDCYAWDPDNFGSLSGVLREPWIIRDSTFRGIITEDIAVLQQLIQKYITLELKAEVLQPYVYKPFIPVLRTISFNFSSEVG
jgi:hypothetical protein